ncbi:hypothetical protein [Haloglomus litoreum]|uniref:hypothetical protein n=1 Tax=Haloglomus litoreum TaxID=3034026 RepID=UPI0023E7FBD3|nr:hypothetical protein [Haloglomus sp. DT116]
MTGEYGSLTEYISAYQRYSGGPPIPDEAAERRGETRKTKAYIPVALAALVLAAIPPALLVGPTASLSNPGLTVPYMACTLGIAWMLMDMLGGAVLDWYEDVPRRGLDRVDAEYGLAEVSTDAV